jgi:hypothetical protein
MTWSFFNPALALYNGFWVIESKQNYNLCIEVPNNSTDNGTQIKLWPKNGGKNQLWKVRMRQNGDTWSFINCNSNKGINIPGGNPNNNVELVQWDYNNQPNELWVTYSAGNDYWRLANQGTGKAMDCVGGQANPGTTIVTWDNYDGESRWWKFGDANVARIFENTNYTGTMVGLVKGSYTMADLADLGMSNDAISSMTRNSNIKIVVYSDDNFSGCSKEYTWDTWDMSGDAACGGNWNDKVSSLKVMDNLPITHSSASIQRNSNVYTLENNLLKAEVSFGSGSLTLSRLYNKLTGNDYLTSPSRLFFYKYAGSEISSNDGGWSAADGQFETIWFQNNVFGQRVTIPLSRTSPSNVTINCVFEIFNDNGGLRYQNIIRNNESVEKKIENSDIIDLNLKTDAHTLNYIPQITDANHNLRWESSTGSLAPNVAFNCICAYNCGEGWTLQPEMNIKTDLPVSSRTYPDNRLPFAKINAWDGISTVRVSTNTSALQLVLLPGEQYEYIAVDMTVFKGDFLDGRMAVQNHLSKAFRYIRNDMYTQLGTNDWDWRSTGVRNGNRNYNYYTGTVIPKAKSANFDWIFVDGDWNTAADFGYSDTAQQGTCWGGNLGNIANATVSNGMKFGLWFSMTGGNYCPAWQQAQWGRDLSNPANIEFKRKQMEDTLIAKYRCMQQMIDLPEFFHSSADASYSHISDAVYRKNVNVKNYMNDLATRYYGFIPKETSEVDEANFESEDFNMLPKRMNNLLHLGYNGYVTQNGGLGCTVPMTMVNFGFLPWESNYISQNSTSSMRDLYKMLTARYVKVPDDPANWSSAFVTLSNKFNTWRKNTRMQDVINGNFKPLKGTDGSGPFAWMHSTTGLSKHYLIAVSDPNTSANQFWAQLRWLDPAKNYLVEEVTIMDDGSNYYKFWAGPTSGADLMDQNKGYFVNVSGTAPATARAFYINAYDGESQKVLYMDENAYTWTECLNGNQITVNVTSGKPNSTTRVIVYDNSKKYGFFHEINLGSNGTGCATYTAGAETGVAAQITYEAETLYSTVNAPSQQIVSEGGASNGGWHKISSNSDGQYVDYAVHVPVAANYKIKIGFKGGADRGKCKLFINGNQFGPEIDMYNSSSGFYQADLGIYTFQSAGWRHFKLQVTGQNGSSTGRNINCDYIYLERQ